MCDFNPKVNRYDLPHTPFILLPPPPSRFTLDEWDRTHRFKERCAEDQSQLADRIYGEVDRVIERTKEQCEANRIESEIRIKERVEEIKFYKQELEQARKDVEREKDIMSVFKDRIQDMMKFLKDDILYSAQKCIAMREGRQGIDLVHDDIETELRKELIVADGVMQMVQRTLEQVHETQRFLRATQYLIDRDIEDKANAIILDENCLNLRQTDLNLSIYYGPVGFDSKDFVPHTDWMNFSIDSIIKSKKAIDASTQLRKYIDLIVVQGAMDMNAQFNRTNEAFRQRIEEQKEKKEKLEQQHFEITRQANEMSRKITEIEKAIAEKESYVALAHTRLGKRCQRTQVELVADEAHRRLLNELVEVTECTSELQQMLNEALASQRYLLKIQIQLEEDLNVKINSLKIDEVDCMSMRSVIRFNHY